jgi:hypothetical protein
MKFNRMIVMGGLALAAFAATGCGRQAGAERNRSASAAATPRGEDVYILRVPARRSAAPDAAEA